MSHHPTLFAVTRDWLHEHRTANGGWTAAQLRVIGIDWPPPKGWQLVAAQQLITHEQKRAFEQAKLDPADAAVPRRALLAQAKAWDAENVELEPTSTLDMIHELAEQVAALIGERDTLRSQLDELRKQFEILAGTRE